MSGLGASPSNRFRCNKAHQANITVSALSITPPTMQADPFTIHQVAWIDGGMNRQINLVGVICCLPIHMHAN